MVKNPEARKNPTNLAETPTELIWVPVIGVTGGDVIEARRHAPPLIKSCRTLSKLI